MLPVVIHWKELSLKLCKALLWDFSSTTSKPVTPPPPPQFLEAVPPHVPLLRL